MSSSTAIKMEKPPEEILKVPLPHVDSSSVKERIKQLKEKMTHQDKEKEAEEEVSVLHSSISLTPTNELTILNNNIQDDFVQVEKHPPSSVSTDRQEDKHKKMSPRANAEAALSTIKKHKRASLTMTSVILEEPYTSTKTEAAKPTAAANITARIVTTPFVHTPPTATKTPMNSPANVMSVKTNPHTDTNSTETSKTMTLKERMALLSANSPKNSASLTGIGKNTGSKKRVSSLSQSLEGMNMIAMLGGAPPPPKARAATTTGHSPSPSVRNRISTEGSDGDLFHVERASIGGNRRRKKTRTKFSIDNGIK